MRWFVCKLTFCSMLTYFVSIEELEFNLATYILDLPLFECAKTKEKYSKAGWTCDELIDECFFNDRAGVSTRKKTIENRVEIMVERSLNEANGAHVFRSHIIVPIIFVLIAIIFDNRWGSFDQRIHLILIIISYLDRCFGHEIYIVIVRSRLSFIRLEVLRVRVTFPVIATLLQNVTETHHCPATHRVRYEQVFPWK